MPSTCWSTRWRTDTRSRRASASPAAAASPRRRPSPVTAPTTSSPEQIAGAPCALRHAKKHRPAPHPGECGPASRVEEDPPPLLPLQDADLVVLGLLDEDRADH